MADAVHRSRPTGDPDGSNVGFEAVARILDIMRAQLGMQTAFIAETDAGTAHVVWSEGPTAGYPMLTGGAMLDGFCARALDAAQTPIVTDTAGAPGLPPGMAQTVGSFAAVPMTLPDGSTFGVLGAVDHEPDPLLQDADAGMIRILARAIGRLIDQHGLAPSPARHADVERIRRVLGGAGLSMVFQPIVDLESRLVLGYEALARFGETPERSPDRWFAEAARVDLGADLEMAAVQAALSHIDALSAGAFLSVNASTATVASPEFLHAVKSIRPGRLVVELTDHLHIEDDRALGTSLATLGMAGVQIATDVSDAGFASLSHLMQLTPDIIKIDGLLVRGIDTDPVRQALARTVVAFADDLGASVVGEAIQTDAELATLKALGVRSGQGMLLAAPGPLR